MGDPHSDVRRVATGYYPGGQAERVDSVLANGDIFTGADAARILRYTGADMAMVGRGAFGNPWIFQEAVARLQVKTIPSHRRLRSASTRRFGS
jgi:tRNA-dihydrouridine synthase